MRLQNYSGHKWFFYQSLHRLTPLLLCPIPFSVSVFSRSCHMIRNRVKVTACNAGSCHSWSCLCPCDFHPQHPWLQPALRAGRGEWSWSDHCGDRAQHAACSSYPDQSIPLRRHSPSLSLSNLANFLRFSDSQFSWSTAAIIAVADCRDCNA